LRSRDASARSRLGSRALASHPFARRGVILPCRGQDLRCVLPRASSVRLAAPLDRVRKMLLADFCNRLTTRAPVDRVIPERGGLRLADRRHPLAQALSGPSSGRLRRQPASSPRGEKGDPAPGRARLTARSPASVHPTTLLAAPHFWGARVEGDRSMSGATSPRRCRPRAMLANDL
jgi:hypothetical protein